MIGKEFLDGTSLDRTVRSKVLIYFVSFLFSILIARIAFIQVIEGELNLKRSIKNRVTLETVKAERGLIYDREGRVLARNRPSYSLFIHPQQVPKAKKLKDQLLELVDTTGAPFFSRHFIDSIFKVEKSLDKKSLGALEFDYSEGNLLGYLLNLTDKEGTPYFDLMYLDSVFSNNVLSEKSLISAASDNSLPFLKDKLLKIYNSEGKYLLDSVTLEKRLSIAYKSRRSKSRLAEDISIEFVSIIQERIGELDGVFIEMEPRREYTYGEHLFHVLGYLGRMDSTEAERMLKEGYERSDKVGKQGIEKQYEDLLHGIDGCRYVEKNVRGRKLGVIDEYPSVLPEAGKNIYLTIDAELQKTIASSLDDTVKGAVVVINPKNGEILAMVSNPSFDANIFSSAKDERGKEWYNANSDPLRPLINKAINGKYPPGSTFKLITGLAVVDSGEAGIGPIHPEEHMPQNCNGTFHFGNTSYDCWRAIGHGSVDLYDAIKSSCNVYFYQVGLRIGYQPINHYARLFSLKDPTGVDLPGERGGYLSGKEAHNRRLAHKGPAWKWTRGLMMNLSIGQSQSLTPLQIAMIPMGIGNGERLYKPHFLMETRTGDNTFLSRSKPQVIQEFSFKPGSIETIKEGMFRVCNAKGGTGSKTMLDYLPVGGKSGSAENPHGKDTHALFVTLAPLDDPEIAIAVVLENVGHGGALAAPVSKVVLDYYFEKTVRGQEIVKKYEGWNGEGWRR